jgi:hypothetical protein
MAKLERMWTCIDNQEVGLEAAILERKRNSSLVKRVRAENVTGIKPFAEAMGSAAMLSGSGAFRKPVKAHREVCWRYRK